MPRRLPQFFRNLKIRVKLLGGYTLIFILATLLSGALWGGYSGLLSAFCFVLFSKSVWVDVIGNKAALFPYTQPALFAMPIAFGLAYLISVTDSSESAWGEKELWHDQYVRAQTGFGSTVSSNH